MTWHTRVKLALAALDPAERGWVERLPAQERALVLQLLVLLDARPLPS